MDAPTVLLQPLCGIAGQPALCYLLDIDGVRVLLDCGWTESFNVELLAPLLRVAHTVDAVLLSHATLRHLGGLPYLFGKLRSDAAVYSTMPVHRLGHLALYDAVLSRAVSASAAFE